MTVSSVSFTVKSPIEEVFALSNDLAALGPLIPDVTKVEVADPMNALLHMTTKIGFMKHTTRLHTVITKLESPSHAEFTGDSDELTLSGSVDLKSLPDGGTEIFCELKTEGKGPLRMIINSFLDSMAKVTIDGFARNIKKMLEA